MRAFVDTEPIRVQVQKLDARLVEHQADLDRTQSSFENGTLGPERFAPLEASYRAEVDGTQKQLLSRQKQLDRYQMIHRISGFLAYVVLGGAFAALFTGFITIDGVPEEIRRVGEPLLLGASWTSYLSLVGFGAVKKEAARTAAEEVDAAVKRAAAGVVDPALATPAKDAVNDRVRERLRAV
jgi:hypothetical protein